MSIDIAPGADFAAVYRDSSPNPEETELKSGDLVLFSKKQPIKSGDIVLAYYREQLHIKRMWDALNAIILTLPGGSGPAETFTDAARENVIIMARAVGFRRKM